MSYHGTSSDVRSPTSTEVRSPTSTSTEVRSPTSTSTEVRSPTSTSTSTDAYTSGNVTVTGGAGAGAYTTVNINPYSPKRSKSTRYEHDNWLARRMSPVARNESRATPNQMSPPNMWKGSAPQRATPNQLSPPDMWGKSNAPPRATLAGISLSLSSPAVQGLLGAALLYVGYRLLKR